MSRLHPILLSPPSPFFHLCRLTPLFSVSGILSSSSHARLWPSQLKPKRVSVLRKSKKKEEPVLEDLPKEYYDDIMLPFWISYECPGSILDHQKRDDCCHSDCRCPLQNPCKHILFLISGHAKFMVKKLSSCRWFSWIKQKLLPN